MKILLVSNGSAATSPPTSVTDGAAIRRGHSASYDKGLSDLAIECSLLVEAGASPATVGSISFVRIWAYFPDAIGANKWFPLGIGTDAGKGKLNSGQPLGETSADLIRHSEILGIPRAATRLAAEVGVCTNIVASSIHVTAVQRD